MSLNLPLRTISGKAPLSSSSKFSLLIASSGDSSALLSRVASSMSTVFGKFYPNMNIVASNTRF